MPPTQVLDYTLKLSINWHIAFILTPLNWKVVKKLFLLVSFYHLSCLYVMRYVYCQWSVLATW